MPGQRSSFVGDSFHQIAITANSVGVEIEQLVLGAIIGCSQPLGGNRHAHTVAYALTERSGRGFDASRLAKLRMASTGAMQLPKILDVIERDRRAINDPAIVANRSTPDKCSTEYSSIDA